jgi:hypothetical protein
VFITVVPPTLPRFHDTDWTRQPGYASHGQLQPPPPPHSLIVPNVEPPRYQAYHQGQQQSYGSNDSSPIQSAPFANAGPPGVQFCPTPEQRSSSVYPLAHRSHIWSRRSIYQ